MKTTTLCFLLKDGQVLLAMKKRGFGIGKWNGVGGKVAEGESVKDAAIREVREEIGVAIDSADLRDMGTLTFRFKDNDRWDNEMHIFVSWKWQGEPKESEEVSPKWMDRDKLEFNDMWIDDRHWLHIVLGGEKIEGEFLFDKNGEAILAKTVKTKAF